MRSRWGPALRRIGRCATSSSSLAVVVALAALMVAPSVAAGSTASAAPLAPLDHASPLTGAAAVNAAAASLADGAGPAGGRPARCTFALGGAVGCSRAAPAGAPGNASQNGTWLNLTVAEGNPPSGRLLGSMVWDAGDGYVLLFGGCPTGSCNGPQDSDTWIFDHGSWTQLSESTSPSARSIAQVAYDPVDNEVVLFGGLPSSSASSGGTDFALDDTWTFAHGLWTNLTGNLSVAPAGRYRGAMTWDAGDGYVLMFGGTSSNIATPYNQTWEFLNQSWTNLDNSTGHPEARYRTAMAYDPTDGYVVLYGGSTTASTETKDTWTYHDYVWRNITANLTRSPGPRDYFGLAWDARDGYLLLVDGGASGSGPPYGGTWSYLGGVWTNLSANLTKEPPNRGDNQMAWDGADDGVLFFGGFAGNPSTATTSAPLSDTWLFGPSVFATVSTSPRTVDKGQSGKVTVTAVTDAAPLTYLYAPLPAGCTSLNTSSLSCAPTTTGNYTIGVNVSDTTGGNRSLETNLSVVADPSIVGFTVGPSPVTAGSSVTFSLGSEYGTPPYRYAYHNLPAGRSGGSSSTYPCAPTAAGNYTVEGEVTDNVGFSVFANVSLIVNPKPSVMSFVATPAVIDFGQSTTFHVFVTGGTGPFNYSYSNLPAGCAPTNGSSLSCAPQGVGGFRIGVNATDAFGWRTNATAFLTVDRALAIQNYALAPGVVDAGVSFTIWMNATSGTAPYTYAYSGLPSGCLSVNASTLTCSTVVAQAYEIHGQATDSVGSVRGETFNVSVNARPSITGASANPAPVDRLVPTTIAITADGGTPPLAYVYTGLPPGCASADSPSIVCNARTSGTFAITANVSDSFGVSASTTLDLDVHPDPSISAFAPSATPIQLGATTTFNVTAVGGVGTIQYVYTDLPAGCTSSDTDALLCAPSAIGLYTVRVTVNDSLGENASADAQLSVVPVPASASTPGSSGVAGLSGNDLLLLAAVVVLAVVLGAIGAFVLRRRRPPSDTTPAAGAAAGTADEAPAADAEWSENAP